MGDGKQQEASSSAMETDEDTEREKLRTELGTLDKRISSLTPNAEDPDVQEVIERKKTRREEVRLRLSSLKPIHTQIKSATERRNKANKRAQELAKEAENLDFLLQAKRQEAEEAKQAATKAQAELKVLQQKEAAEVATTSQQPMAPSPFTSGQTMSAQQWAQGFMTTLQPPYAQQFQQFMNVIASQSSPFASVVEHTQQVQQQQHLQPQQHPQQLQQQQPQELQQQLPPTATATGPTSSGGHRERATVAASTAAASRAQHSDPRERESQEGKLHEPFFQRQEKSLSERVTWGSAREWREGLCLRQDLPANFSTWQQRWARAVG